jgi:hypothetical protein
LARSGAQQDKAPRKRGRTRVKRNQSEAAAEQQKENTSDRQLAQQIRRALGKDKSLATVLTEPKKGPVSEQEKQAIAAKAQK